MKRWMASMPRYRSPIILQRAHEGAASRVGNQRVGSNNVRVLKALSTISSSGVVLPSVAAPANHLAPPGDYATGWRSWWPSPPDKPGSNYQIPDPPVIARTVLPTADNPILWEATAEVGTSVWQARISAVYVHCEWMPKTGKEMMSGIHDLSIEQAALKIRPSIIATANVNTVEWNVIRLSDDSVWKLEAMQPSFRRQEFVELLVQRENQ